mgnify:FL=1
MERLQSLLRQYNLSHEEDFALAPWSKQYSEDIFPKYWEVVYSILQPLDKRNKVLEIGCGLGDITAILCYSGFNNITAFEKDESLCRAAQRRIEEIFGRNDVIHNANYPSNMRYNVDILILVNCVYADMAKTKQEYLDLLQKYYISAGSPHYFIMEVIDTSYTIEDEEFPEYVRLSYEDVKNMFSNYLIHSWATYIYPQNNKSKTLYLIEKK